MPPMKKNPKVKYPSWMKLRMTDREYADANATMEKWDVDIDDGREIAKFLLKRIGVKTED